MVLNDKPGCSANIVRGDAGGLQPGIEFVIKMQEVFSTSMSVVGLVLARLNVSRLSGWCRLVTNTATCSLLIPARVLMWRPRLLCKKETVMSDGCATSALAAS